MLKLHILNTGSDGNCSVLDNGKTKIVIDAGITTKKWNELSKISFVEVDGLLITHAHSDHIASMFNGFLAHNFNHSIIHMTEKVLDDVATKWSKKLTRFRPDLMLPSKLNQTIKIGTFLVTIRKMHHYGYNNSAISECVGYEIYDTINNKKIAWATDSNSFEHFQTPEKGFDLYCLEDNYDEDFVKTTYEMSSMTPQDKVKYIRTQDHMSTQKLSVWLYHNNPNDAPVIRLHESPRNHKPGIPRSIQGEYYKEFWKEIKTHE